MRGALAILFAILFGLGPLTATFAGDDASLPACCRRHGAHQCAMADAALARMIQAALNSSAFTAPSHCPQYPIPGNAAPSSALALAHAPQAVTAGIPEILPGPPFDAHVNSIHLSTPALRGPPALTLAS
jgi:hypothetical protein